MLIDLHSHSSASDGTLSPRQLVKCAQAKGIKVLSLTDHDTVDGLAEAETTARHLQIKFIPGVELSAEFPSTLHILGYHINYQHPELLEILKRIRKYRVDRNLLIIQRFKQLGIDVSFEELERIAGGEVIGRPHFARLLVGKGVVKTLQEAFDKYLYKHGPAYVDKKRLDPGRALQLIISAGGLPVLAHPVSLKLNPGELETLIKDLVSQGLKGIECFYPDHRKADRELYRRLAGKYQLLITAGSDFHGDNKPQDQLGLEFKDISMFTPVIENKIPLS